MNRAIVGAVATLLAGTLVTGSGHAQATVFVAAGPTFPIGEYGDYAKTGWLAMAGFTVPVGPQGLSVGGNLVYGSNKHSDVAGDKTNLPGVFGFLQYRVGPGDKPGVYFYGQLGALNHQYKSATPAANDSEWGFAWGGGAGVDIPVGRVSLFVEASLIARDGTNLVPLVAGLAIPVGTRR
jgi:hypothetical protein